MAGKNHSKRAQNALKKAKAAYAKDKKAGKLRGSVSDYVDREMAKEAASGGGAFGYKYK